MARVYNELRQIHLARQTIREARVAFARAQVALSEWVRGAEIRIMMAAATDAEARLADIAARRPRLASRCEEMAAEVDALIREAGDWEAQFLRASAEVIRLDSIRAPRAGA